MVYKIRPSGAVLTGPGVRRRTVGDVTLEFGKEPVYLDSLPRAIAQDPHLIAKEVSEGEVVAAGGVIIRLSPGSPGRDDEGDDSGEEGLSASGSSGNNEPQIDETAGGAILESAAD